MRNRLEVTRSGRALRFKITARTEPSENSDGGALEEYSGHIHTGLYPDGKLGEIFVTMGRAGSADAWLDQWAVSTSVALQHGADVDNLFRKFVGTQFYPSGATNVKGVSRCTSPVDLIARWILNTYGTEVET